MRVQFQMSGGIGYFPGLAASRTIDADALSEEDRRALKQLVEDAQFFELPARTAAPRGAADYQTYEITVEDGGRQHTVVFSDPVTQPAVKQLVDRLRALTSRSSR
jgi:hypothetical protein